MAMTAGTVRASSAVRVSGTFPPQGVSSTLVSSVIRQAASAGVVLTYGTASGNVDLITGSDRTLTAGANVTYDLYVGTDLLNLAGETTCAFRKVKYAGIFIVSGGDTAGIRIGGAAANEWIGFFVAAGDKQDHFPSGPPWQVGSPAGKAVGATTKNLKVENLGAVSVTYRVVIAGTSV